MTGAEASGGAGGTPPRGTSPPRTFTGLIIEEQLEYYGFNT